LDCKQAERREEEEEEVAEEEERDTHVDASDWIRNASGQQCAGLSRLSWVA
jgi:hypothetical protein